MMLRRYHNVKQDKVQAVTSPPETEPVDVEQAKKPKIKRRTKKDDAE